MAEPKRNTIWASPNAADSNRSGLIGWDRARTSLSTLGVPGFPALLGSNLFGKMGFSTAQMAQAWLVLEMTDSDALVGMVNGLPAIPVIALALFGGVLADQGNRRQLLVLARVAMAGLGFTGGALIATESISYWHVVAIAFGVAILNVFATTVNGALLGDTVERQRLFSANALYSTASNLAVFAGPAAGGLLIGSVGIQAAYFGLVGMFIVSSVAALGVRPEQPDGDDGKPPKRVLGDLLDGFRYMAANPTLRWLILLVLMIVFGALFLPVTPRLARDYLDVGAGGYGGILAARGVGGLLGGVTLLLAGNVRAIAQGLVVATAVFFGLTIVFAFSTSLYLSMAASFGLGLVIIWWISLLKTAFLLTSSEEMRGRVMSVIALISQMAALSWLVGGFASEIIGPRATLIAGAALTASLYALAFVRSPDLRRVGS